MGASVDVFGKATVLKQADLKTAEWNKFYASFLTEMKNTFIEELKKYERRALEPWLTKAHMGNQQSSAHLRKLIQQVASLKQRMSGYRPLLSDDIVVAFEILLWLIHKGGHREKHRKSWPYIFENEKNLVN